MKNLVHEQNENAKIFFKKEDMKTSEVDSAAGEVITAQNNMAGENRDEIT